MATFAQGSHQSVFTSLADYVSEPGYVVTLAFSEVCLLFGNIIWLTSFILIDHLIPSHRLSLDDSEAKGDMESLKEELLSLKLMLA
jgi:hypothetical protein